MFFDHDDQKPYDFIWFLSRMVEHPVNSHVLVIMSGRRKLG